MLHPSTGSAPGARPGFTVAELLIAAFVLSVALTGASFAMTSAFGTYRNQDRTLVRQQLVHDQMESIAGARYETLKQAIKGARSPAAKPRADFSPTEDFQSVNAGEALVSYELEPPKDGTGDWIPRAVNQDTSIQTSQTRYTPNLDATLRLQYWDPQFDQPTLVDKGLIRAKFSLTGDGTQSEAVRYVTR